MFATETPAMVASRNSSPRNDWSAVAGLEVSEGDMRAVERWTGPCAVLKRGDHTGAVRIALTGGKRADGAGRMVATALSARNVGSLRARHGGGAEARVGGDGFDRRHPAVSLRLRTFW